MNIPATAKDPKPSGNKGKTSGKTIVLKGTKKNGTEEIIRKGVISVNKGPAEDNEELVFVDTQEYAGTDDNVELTFIDKRSSKSKKPSKNPTALEGNPLKSEGTEKGNGRDQDLRKPEQKSANAQTKMSLEKGKKWSILFSFCIIQVEALGLKLNNFAIF